MLWWSHDLHKFSRFYVCLTIFLNKMCVRFGFYCRTKWFSGFGNAILFLGNWVDEFLGAVCAKKICISTSSSWKCSAVQHNGEPTDHKTSISRFLSLQNLQCKSLKITTFLWAIIIHQLFSCLEGVITVSVYGLCVK